MKDAYAKIDFSSVVITNKTKALQVSLPVGLVPMVRAKEMAESFRNRLANAIGIGCPEIIMSIVRPEGDGIVPVKIIAVEDER